MSSGFSSSLSIAPSMSLSLSSEQSFESGKATSTRMNVKTPALSLSPL